MGGGSGFDHGTSSMEAIHMVEETRQSDAGFLCKLSFSCRVYDFFFFLNCITSLAIVVWLHCAMSPLGFFFEIVFPTIFLALPHRCLNCVLVSLLVTFLNCLLVNLKAKVLLFHNFHSFIFSRLDKHA